MTVQARSAPLGIADILAAAIVVVGIVAVTWLLRHRTRSRRRRLMIGAVTGVLGVGFIAALVLPTYALRPAPLILSGKSAAGAQRLAQLGTASATASGHRFMALGFVASDYDDSAAGIDHDAPRLTSLAATGITLSDRPGQIDVTDASDTQIRSHLDGAQAFAVVSNS